MTSNKVAMKRKKDDLIRFYEDEIKNFTEVLGMLPKVLEVCMTTRKRSRRKTQALDCA